MESQRIYGLNNEEEILTYLVGKRVKELDEKWKKHILTMFPFANCNDVIEGEHFPNKASKVDIVLKIRHTKKYISIKTGKNPSMHHESYDSFSNFLYNLGVDSRTLNIIHFFHYGQSTKLGNLDRPMMMDELNDKYAYYFHQASEVLDNPKIIEAVIDRCVIHGTELKKTRINFLYYGDVKHGHLLSVEDIYSIIFAYRDHDRYPIHFGGLNYVPNSRNPKRKESHFVRIRWPLLSNLYYVNEDDVMKMKLGTFKAPNSSQDK